MVGWLHWLDGHEFKQALGDGEGPGSLVCYRPWHCKESDTTEWLNNTNILPMTETFDVLFISSNPHYKITKVNIYDPTFISEETGSGTLWQISSVAHSTTFHFSFSFLIEPWYLPLKVSCLLYVAGTSGVPSLTQQERRGNWFTSANLNNPLSPFCHGLV